jgi:hypothetical protein
MNPADKFREQAARARDYARLAAMEEDRFAWLAIAERWELLARATDKESQNEADE